MTPVEYKFAAEQMASCLHNGIGVIARSRIAPNGAKPYELNGWLQEVTELVTKWHKSTTGAVGFTTGTHSDEAPCT